MRSSSGPLSLAVLLARFVGANPSCLSITSQFPDCALSCIKDAASKVGCTNTADVACQCTPASSAAILATAQPCVVKCGVEQAVPAINAGSSLCACVASATETPVPSSSSLPPFANSSAPAKQASQSGQHVYGTTLPKVTNSAISPEPTSTGSINLTSSMNSEKPPTTEAPCSADCGPVASSAVPRCAQPCFSSYVPQVGCDVADYQCQCQPAAQQSLSQLLVPCVATACPPEAIPSVISGASSVCACASAGADCGGSTDIVTKTGAVITKTETRLETVTSCETDEQSTPVDTVTQPLPTHTESPPSPSCSGQPDCGQPEQTPTTLLPTESCSEMPQPSCPGSPDCEQQKPPPVVVPQPPICSGQPGCEQQKPPPVIVPQPPACSGQPSCEQQKPPQQPPSVVPQPPSGQPQPPSGKPQPPAGRPQPPSEQPQPPSERPQPPSGQPQPPSGQPQPPTGQPQPPAGEQQPPAVKPQPPAGQPQPPSSGQQPQPPTYQPQPPSGERLPPAVKPQPPAGQVPPPAGQVQPPEVQPQPCTGQPGCPPSEIPARPKPQPCTGQPGCVESEKPTQGKPPSGSGKPNTTGGGEANKPTMTSVPPPPKEAAPSVVQPGSAGRCQVGLATVILGAFWVMVLFG
ncbi:hypothetical protein L249_6565 [Ophiocordyceps polyrhachis-furcata BCC 54312]|uniref:CFEM domain-containing protein n=1 Tax=Ophiocordyceps polyrhachis-furcata BCC 54312 TaxID=1330021 RepID=A0A367LLU3_9HYPO|nr:hypothetical protein L249_6565 [Ophiocordyceps polyrhachis-furcata BCC 54312]